MAGESGGTKAVLLAEAARLMASGGVYQVTNREIIEAAGQKNASALSYHFGSRDDLIVAVLTAMGPALEAKRVERGDLLDGRSSTVAIIDALLLPYGECLHSEEGRHYVQIVDQLRGQFVTYRTTAVAGEPELQRLLAILDERPADLEPAIRRERLVAMVTLMTAMVAERSRELQRGRIPRIDHERFLDNLANILVGVIEAPHRVRA